MSKSGMALIRKHHGLMSRIASDLGISRGAVNMWRDVPAERVPEVARITGFSRHQLRPDLWEPDSRPEQGDHERRKPNAAEIDQNQNSHDQLREVQPT